MSKFYIQNEQDISLTILFSDMEGDNDGNGWKFGLSFICCGIVFVMGMGIFSLVYHAQYKGKQGYLFTLFFQHFKREYLLNILIMHERHFHFLSVVADRL